MDKKVSSIQYQVSEKGYQKLKVWQEAHLLTILVYKITKRFPREELFGLVSQMRRAAVSVVANIVEGQARRSKKEFLQFLYIANSSLAELEYFLQLSLELSYLSLKDFEMLEKKRLLVGKLLNGLIKSKSEC